MHVGVHSAIVQAKVLARPKIHPSVAFKILRLKDGRQTYLILPKEKASELNQLAFEIDRDLREGPYAVCLWFKGKDEDLAASYNRRDMCINVSVRALETGVPTEAEEHERLHATFDFQAGKVGTENLFAGDIESKTPLSATENPYQFNMSFDEIPAGLLDLEALAKQIENAVASNQKEEVERLDRLLLLNAACIFIEAEELDEVALRVLEYIASEGEVESATFKNDRGRKRLGVRIALQASTVVIAYLNPTNKVSVPATLRKEMIARFEAIRSVTQEVHERLKAVMTKGGESNDGADALRGAQDLERLVSPYFEWKLPIR